MRQVFPKDRALAIATLAGLTVSGTEELMNPYWPRTETYFDLIVNSPWWLLYTEIGHIKIGWRKRVIEISWAQTGHPCIVTDDDVTKGEYYVHAWSEEDTVKYLKRLKESVQSDRRKRLEEAVKR
jgi:hypothetical protein